MRKPNWEYVNIGLPKQSKALADLDALCQKMGEISRGEAIRFLVIAWSEAQSGGTLLTAPPTAMPAATAPMVQQPEPPKRPAKMRANKSADAAILDLDL